MATLTADEIAAMRPWVGPSVTDAELQTRYTRLDNLDDVVEETLQAQLSTLLEQPSSTSLPSGLSVTITQNLTELRQMIKRFQNSTGIDSDSSPIPGVGKLARADRR